MLTKVEEYNDSVEKNSSSFSRSDLDELNVAINFDKGYLTQSEAAHLKEVNTQMRENYFCPKISLLRKAKVKFEPKPVKNNNFYAPHTVSNKRRSQSFSVARPSDMPSTTKAKMVPKAQKLEKQKLKRGRSYSIQ